MTTTQQPPQPSAEQQNDSWRGYAEEGNDELSRATTVRLKEQSRKLLGELLRPYKKMIWLLVVIVVVENAARLVGAVPGPPRHRQGHPADPGR